MNSIQLVYYWLLVQYKSYCSPAWASERAYTVCSYFFWFFCVPMFFCRSFDVFTFFFLFVFISKTQNFSFSFIGVCHWCFHLFLQECARVCLSSLAVCMCNAYNGMSIWSFCGYLANLNPASNVLSLFWTSILGGQKPEVCFTINSFIWLQMSLKHTLVLCSNWCRHSWHIHFLLLHWAQSFRLNAWIFCRHTISITR